MYSAYNWRYWHSINNKSNSYLLGGSYITDTKKIINLEFYHHKDNYLFLLLGNQGHLYNNWSWQITELINLDDYGEYRKFSLSYLGVDDWVPEVEIINIAGAEDSKYKADPREWSINFKFKVDIL